MPPAAPIQFLERRSQSAWPASGVQQCSNNACAFTADREHVHAAQFCAVTTRCGGCYGAYSTGGLLKNSCPGYYVRPDHLGQASGIPPLPRHDLGMLSGRRRRRQRWELRDARRKSPSTSRTASPARPSLRGSSPPCVCACQIQRNIHLKLSVLARAGPRRSLRPRRPGRWPPLPACF